MHSPPQGFPLVVRFLGTIIVLIVSGLIFGWVTSTPAQAAGRYWRSDGIGVNTWDNPGSWSSTPGLCTVPGGDPGVPGSGDVAIFSSSCTSNVTINATADLGGMEIQAGYTGTVTQGSGIGVTIGSSNFSQAAGTFTGAAAAIDVNGSFTITGGTFTSTSGTLSVSENWTHSGGTFTHNSGSVTLDGSTQTLNDDNTFYNLTKSVSSADTLTVEASSTQTVSNTLTLDGTSSATLSLRSSSSGTKFTLAPASATTVTYLDVKDSQASTSSITCSTGCTNSGSNDDGEAAPHWIFSGAGGSNTAPTVSSLRAITQVGDTVTFETDVNDADGDKTQLLVEYSTNQASWKKATISKVSASQGDATITPSATYPIASIDTDSGKIKLTITWNAKDNFASSEESKVYLRLTPYDGTDVGTAVISDSFALDTRAPVVSNLYLKARTSESLTPAWTPESEKNFEKYVLCFGRSISEAKACATRRRGPRLLAGQWTSADDSKLATFSTSETTITRLWRNTTYYIYLKATDKFGHTSTLLSQAVVTTDAPAPPFLTVAGITGAVIDLAWTGTTSTTFTRYDICYGQVATRVTGSSCRPTGDPSGAVLKTITNKATVTTSLTGLKENTRYYVKIWLRDSKYGIIAGNSLSATTCKAGEKLLGGKCIVPTPVPTPIPTPIPPTPTPAPLAETPTPAPPTPEPLAAATPTPEIIQEDQGTIEGGIIAFIEETFGERAAEVVQKVIAVAKKVVQTVVRVVKAVAEVVPTQPAVVIPVVATAAVAVAASTGLVTVVPNFAGELFYLGQRLMQGLIGLAGARRRYPWGRVVDAASGAPLPQTIVRILDRQTQKLRDTAITDAKGDFTSLLPAGQYRFEAIKPGWHLEPAPASFLNILRNQQIYDGSAVDVKREGVVAIIIAMRTATQQEVAHFALRAILQRIEKFLTALSWPLLIFGSILSVLALVKAQTALNIGIAILYVVLIGAKLYVQRNRQETTGQVKDTATNQPLKEALVQLYNAETGRLMATKVTSAAGQFALVPPPGVYTVIVSKAGYTTYKESHVIIHPEKQKALAMTFQLTPEAPQRMSVESLAA